MKKIIIKIAFLFFMLPLVNSCRSAFRVAETGGQLADMERMVGVPDFTFKATYAYPTGFHHLYLSPTYDVKVVRDTIESCLPYYGRAYTAPIDPREGGYRFTSTSFEYRVRHGRKKDSWEAVITLHDLDRPIKFHFNIWGNGKAWLNVTDVNRQSISFQGEIAAN